jgi:hypothetical protein
MKRDLFWTGLLTRVARQGAISYVDLKKLPIDEFLLLYMEYEKSMSDGTSRTGYTNTNKGSAKRP